MNKNYLLGLMNSKTSRIRLHPLITNPDSVNRKLKSVTELINELDHYKHMFTTLTNHLNTIYKYIEI